MTPKEVQERMERVLESSGDIENAHALDDELRADILRAIATGRIVDAQRCAQIALRTEHIDRWYA